MDVAAFPWQVTVIVLAVAGIQRFFAAASSKYTIALPGTLGVLICLPSTFLIVGRLATEPVPPFSAGKQFNGSTTSVAMMASLEETSASKAALSSDSPEATRPVERTANDGQGELQEQGSANTEIEAASSGAQWTGGDGGRPDPIKIPVARE